MWTEILGWALLVSLNPMLLGAIVLVISRPRPVQNLLAFWVGCVIVNVPALLIPLVALHSVPSFAALAQELATPDPPRGSSPAAGHGSARTVPRGADPGAQPGPAAGACAVRERR